MIIYVHLRHIKKFKTTVALCYSLLLSKNVDFNIHKETISLRPPIITLRLTQKKKLIFLFLVDIPLISVKYLGLGYF